MNTFIMKNVKHYLLPKEGTMRIRNKNIKIKQIAD